MIPSLSILPHPKSVPISWQEIKFAKDMDILIEPSPENAQRILGVLNKKLSNRESDKADLSILEKAREKSEKLD